MYSEGLGLGIRQIKRVRVRDIVFRRRSDCKTAGVVAIRLLDELVPLARSIAEPAAHNSLIQARESKSRIRGSACNVSSMCSNAAILLHVSIDAAVESSHCVV
jgi:hypothetical protein